MNQPASGKPIENKTVIASLMKGTQLAVSLSARGLANIPYGEEKNDFEFIVGNGEFRYRCSWFVADFLSPRIAALHAVDNTICSYEVATKDSSGEFGKFLLLGRGKSICIDSTNRDFYELLSEELLNEELLTLSCSEKCEELSRDTVLKRLDHRHRMNLECSKEISFIASHFHEIDISGFPEFDHSILSQILSSDELMIKSEDWLYEMIWKLVANDRELFCLLQFIQFEFVSKSIADRFIADGVDFIDLINSSIWLTLGRRFVGDFSSAKSTRRLVVSGRRFSPTGQSLDGIISYLTSKCGQNVHDGGFIEVTSNGVHGSNNPKRATDFQNRNSFFYSTDEPNSWICYDFKNMEVTPSHYSILSYPARPNQHHHPKSWCLEVSVDGQSWAEVHRCENNSDVNGSNQIGTYSVDRSVKCRFVRLRQIGKNHVNGDYLLLCGFEIFGLLRDA
jgi:hypothetical protein